MLRSAATDQGGLEVLSIAGAREAEGRFADALRDHTALKDLRFRDAPLVSDDGGGARRGLRVDAGGRGRVADQRRPRCAQALSGCALLRRCAVDGCDLFDDDALDTLLASSALEELSCRRCPKLAAGACWRSCATLGIHLRRLRCDLRRGGISKLRARGARRVTIDKR